MFADDIVLYKPISLANRTLLIFKCMSTLWPTRQNQTILAIKADVCHSQPWPSMSSHFSTWWQVGTSFKVPWSMAIRWSDLGKACWVCHKQSSRHLGYIFLRFCSPDSLIRLYYSQVLPLINYGCVVYMWDPHLVKHKQQLEKVQVFAARIASKQWSERNYLKLLYLYKLINGYVSCPYGLLVFNPNPNLRISHEKQLIQP